MRDKPSSCHPIIWRRENRAKHGSLLSDCCFFEERRERMVGIVAKDDGQNERAEKAETLPPSQGIFHFLAWILA